MDTGTDRKNNEYFYGYGKKRKYADAAATNAALAWLGGGALAASGGGMAAGEALLALAGPVGWGIAGATLLTSVVLFTNKKIKLDKEKKLGQHRIYTK